MDGESTITALGWPSCVSEISAAREDHDDAMTMSAVSVRENVFTVM